MTIVIWNSFALFDEQGRGLGAYYRSKIENPFQGNLFLEFLRSERDEL